GLARRTMLAIARCSTTTTHHVVRLDEVAGRFVVEVFAMIRDLAMPRCHRLAFSNPVRRPTHGALEPPVDPQHYAPSEGCRYARRRLWWRNSPHRHRRRLRGRWPAAGWRARHHRK